MNLNWQNIVEIMSLDHREVNFFFVLLTLTRPGFFGCSMAGGGVESTPP